VQDFFLLQSGKSHLRICRQKTVEAANTLGKTDSEQVEKHSPISEDKTWLLILRIRYFRY
jgi:hypothetical protein